MSVPKTCGEWERAPFSWIVYVVPTASFFVSTNSSREDLVFASTSKLREEVTVHVKSMVAADGDPEHVLSSANPSSLMLERRSTCRALLPRMKIRGTAVTLRVITLVDTVDLPRKFVTRVKNEYSVSGDSHAAAFQNKKSRQPLKKSSTPSPKWAKKKKRDQDK